MRNRFTDAKAIIDGACNPIAIANALVKAVEEARKEKPSTDEVSHDVAVQAIVYQLAHLTGVFRIERDFLLFDALLEDLKYRVANPIPESEE